MVIFRKSICGGCVCAYDAVGNRIGSSQQTGTWQYNQDNQLTQQGEGQEKTSYTYTANGNIASETQGETSKTYTYDASDRLIRITSTANGSETEIARYAYDPMGRRIAKTIEGHTTYFLYTEEGLIAELNQQGKLTKAYGWVADTSYSTSPLWQAEPQAGEATITDLKQAQFHTLTTDHLGTVQMATNEAGEVTWKAQSEAFGRTTPDEQNQITMNLRFPGQYFDEETGTHYNYFRDYQPTTGRYIQRDPVGLKGGINTYAYVNGNPLKNSDTFGLKPSDVAALETAFLTGNIEAIKWLLTQGALNYRYEKLARLMLQNLALAQAATSSTNQNAWCQEEKNEHDDYHKMCDRKNPYKGQTCDWAKFELETALLCEQKRSAWMERWDHIDNAHVGQLLMVLERIVNAENKVKRYCK